MKEGLRDKEKGKRGARMGNRKRIKEKGEKKEVMRDGEEGQGGG